ncbi:MAG: hypothetical protein HWE16_07360 [Gammaproteobacteria bacterium]|nr:hypothetical protein [Gammaproteobacteria bacterium]
MMEYLPLIISLISGAAGGNLVPKLMKNLNAGGLINTISGAVGGWLGGTTLSGMIMGATGADPASAMDLTAILSNIGGGVAGGGIVAAIVGFVKKMISGSGS